VPNVADQTIAHSLIEYYAERSGQAWAIAHTLYTPEELADLPRSAVDVALGLGHPVRDAYLQPGEVIVDIGCGAGIDLLLAALRVGPAGRAIGVDLTPEMVLLARNHASQMGLVNVEVSEGAMEALPLDDRSVDVVVSNGVFNLSTDKSATFAEAYRVLRPGGRMVVADMLLVTDLPQGVRDNPKLWSG
jgi:ubiquinone/menaquinone biosynthesis C-methylase UbiE